MTVNPRDRKEWRNMSNKHLTWDELEAEIFTPEEIAESRARVEIISSIIDARQAKGLSQKELAEITGLNSLRLPDWRMDISVRAWIQSTDFWPLWENVLRLLTPDSSNACQYQDSPSKTERLP